MEKLVRLYRFTKEKTNKCHAELDSVSLFIEIFSAIFRLQGQNDR